MCYIFNSVNYSFLISPLFILVLDFNLIYLRKTEFLVCFFNNGSVIKFFLENEMHNKLD